jgi:hypothetical protein
MKFRFRAEYVVDAIKIKAVLQGSLLVWKETAVFLDTKPVPYKIPDLEVEFETDETGPSLDQIREIMSNIQDCHIARQTVNLAEKYTGERNHNL